MGVPRAAVVKPGPWWDKSRRDLTAKLSCFQGGQQGETQRGDRTSLPGPLNFQHPSFNTRGAVPASPRGGSPCPGVGEWLGHAHAGGDAPRGVPPGFQQPPWRSLALPALWTSPSSSGITRRSLPPPPSSLCPAWHGKKQGKRGEKQGKLGKKPGKTSLLLVEAQNLPRGAVPSTRLS